MDTIPTYYMHRSPVGGDPASVKLHLSVSPEFPRRYGRKVKRAGGLYTECRGYCSHRYVKMPITDDTIPLINAMITDFGGVKSTTVIFDHKGNHSLPAWVVVQQVRSGESIQDAVVRYATSLANACGRGIIRREPKPLTAEEIAREAQVQRARDLADSLTRLGYEAKVAGFGETIAFPVNVAEQIYNRLADASQKGE